MDGNLTLGHLERFFAALGDKTRLRLINLMRDDEICVCFFTEVLGDSQPKISRHLAYLRSAGLVKARRDGKWMHYSLKWPEDHAQRAVLRAVLDLLKARPDLEHDHEIYASVCCTPEALVQIARTPMPFMEAHLNVEPEMPAPRPASPAHNELEEFLL